MGINSSFRFYLLALCFLVAPILVNGQQPSGLQNQAATADTPRSAFVEKMQAFAKKSAITSAKEFEADKAAMVQLRVLEEVKQNIQQAKFYLKNVTDTNTITARLNAIGQDYATAVDGVLTNRGTAQTFRNLTASAKILNELQAKANNIKATLDNRQEQLHRYRYTMDSLLNTPALFAFPPDSATLGSYLQQLIVVAKEAAPVDSVLKQASLGNQNLLNKINSLVFKLNTSIDEIAGYSHDMGKNTFRREFGNIWESIGYHRPFQEILQQAKAKLWLTLAFYVENNSGKFMLLAAMLMTCFLYLRSLKSIYRDNELLAKNYEGQLVLRYPLFSAMLLVINVGQFLFFSPPFILSVIFWTIAAISLSVLFYNYITKYWLSVWLIMVSLFLFTATENLILQASRTERWAMILISLCGAIAGVIIVTKGKKQELREKLILYAIGLMVALEFTSLIANIFGRYNLAKSLLISGYLNVVVAILFLWTIRLINEGLYLAFSIYTQQDRKLFYVNFDKVGKKVPTGFYVLLIFGWFILFGRNFAGFEYLVTPVREFFEKNRTLGDYNFSINGLLLFFMIMGVSVIISKIVSFFAADKHLAHDKEQKDSAHGVGSWLLLIRIIILSLGLFLAIAAAGIPLDRITIVIGALGVGIGFGLQNVVNNLVSGLIIAFEKPVNVGDIVDIDGQSGTMKSLGFRSSVIATWDGADVVMPNGDLLNSHLINWSLAGNRKRISITVGIAYDANLEEVKMLINELLDQDQRILKKPGPNVNYEQFGPSAIDMKIYFWVREWKEAGTVKSDTIVAISSLFRQHTIAIPFPQQDVHLHGTANKQV